MEKKRASEREGQRKREREKGGVRERERERENEEKETERGGDRKEADLGFVGRRGVTGLHEWETTKNRD